jgi:hypothetical protein
MSQLLKLLGREGFTADVKMGYMVKVPAGTPVVVITNFPEALIFSEPLRARLIDCHIHTPVD